MFALKASSWKFLMNFSIEWRPVIIGTLALPGNSIVASSVKKWAKSARERIASR
jgi:hypothetical protein